MWSTKNGVVPLVLLVILLAFVSIGKSDPITSLPGYTGPSVNQFSGYITVDQREGKALFYWLIESLVSPTTAPLVVWFQGGPGCSSLFGLFVEHGPFRPNMDGGLDFNPNTWVNVANMLYVESPAGVGFSYSNTSVGRVTNDNITLTDNYAFLQGFLLDYPQYVGRDMWITGESYGGVYVPSLSEKVLFGPDATLSQMLKGFMVGNPVIRCGNDSPLLARNTQVNIFYWHGLVSYSNFLAWNDNGCDVSSFKAKCISIYEVINEEIGREFQQAVQPGLDPDDLYENFCTGNGSLDFSSNLPNEPDCIAVDTLAQNYLNQIDVQQAIHARPTKWVACADPPQLEYTPSFPSMIPFYENIFNGKPGFNVLIYSGDIDINTVPFPYTQQCMSILKRPIVNNWQPWLVNQATAGYVEVYDKYTYATVKGGGHETPQYQSLNSLNMFSRFLMNQTLNTPPTPSFEKKVGPLRPVRSGDVLRKMRQNGITSL